MKKLIEYIKLHGTARTDYVKLYFNKVSSISFDQKNFLT